MWKGIRTVVITTLVASGCTWVDLEPDAKQVQIGYAGDLAQCERIGVINANTKARVVMARDEAKVQEELYTLARNNAADLGATNLVQHGRPKDGEQSFTAYRCAGLG
ncbi:MAG: DUF4156 domain-containing protein [Pseudomonadota bacterium]